MPIDTRPLSNPVPEDGEESNTTQSGAVHKEGLSPFEVQRQREQEAQKQQEGPDGGTAWASDNEA